MSVEDVVATEGDAERIVDIPGGIEIPDYIAMHSFKLGEATVAYLVVTEPAATQR